MAYRLEDIDGLDEAFFARLTEVGVRSTSHLLQKWAQDRQVLKAVAAGDEVALHRLLSLADLSRIRGVGATYAMLLHDVGVDGSASLCTADPQALHVALGAAKERVRGAKRLPTPADLEKWIADARTLPPVDR